MADRLERIRSRFSYVRCKDAVLDRTGFKRYSFPPSRSFPRLVYSSLDPTLSLSLSLSIVGRKRLEDTKGPENRRISEGREKWNRGEGQEEGWRERRTSNSTLYEISSPSSFGTFYPPLFRLLLIMPPLLLFASSREESRPSYRIDYRETTIQMDKSVSQNIFRTLLRNLGWSMVFWRSQKSVTETPLCDTFVDSRDVSRFGIFEKLIKSRFFSDFLISSGLLGNCGLQDIFRKALHTNSSHA